MYARATLFTALSLSTALAASAAAADVTISSDVTQNMSCSAGVCAPTAVKAVLNINDLVNYLAQLGNLRIVTAGNGVEANSIVVAAPFATQDSTSLTLDAREAITVNAVLSVGSSAAELELQSGERSKIGWLRFGAGGRVYFASLSDIFGINGEKFTLVSSVKGLADAVAANPSGAYALSRDYDARGDGLYTKAPVSTTFDGYFEGLGHTISELTVSDSIAGDNAGLFANTSQNAVLSGIRLVNVSISGTASEIGALAGYNYGAIEGAQVGGVVSAASDVDVIEGATVGGLVGRNDGVITGSLSAVRVRPSKGAANGGEAGGLVANNWGTIINSSSSGTIDRAAGGTEIGGLVGHNDEPGIIRGSYAMERILPQNGVFVGGLVGENDNVIDQCFASGAIRGGAITVGGLVSFSGGAITNSYATGGVTGTLRHATISYAGGLIGQNFSTVANSYSIGRVKGGGAVPGGLIGDDMAESGDITATYWDTVTSGIRDLSQGAGNIANDPGITGLTTAELQMGLPPGFDPNIWAENTKINNGMPYLIANPPPR